MSDWLTATAALHSGSASEPPYQSIHPFADSVALAESITHFLRFPLIYHVTLDSRDNNLTYFASSWITKWETLEYNPGLHGSSSPQTVHKAHLAFCWLSDAAFKEHLAAKLDFCARKRLSFLLSSQIPCATYPVQLNGVDPLPPALRVLCSEVPHAVVYAYVQAALVKLVRLKKTTKKQNDEKRKWTRNWVNFFVPLICRFFEEKATISCSAE